MSDERPGHCSACDGHSPDDPAPFVVAAPVVGEGRLRPHLEALLEMQDEPCRFDHHGNCQAHYVEKPCRVAEARAALAAKP